jgi:hypothetical protein
MQLLYCGTNSFGKSVKNIFLRKQDIIVHDTYHFKFRLS